MPWSVSSTPGWQDDTRKYQGPRATGQVTSTKYQVPSTKYQVPGGSPEFLPLATSYLLLNCPVTVVTCHLLLVTYLPDDSPRAQGSNLAAGVGGAAVDHVAA